MSAGGSFQIQMNPGDVANVKAMLEGVKNGVPKVMKRAVDLTMGTVKTTVSREAGKVLNALQRDIKGNIGVRKYDTAAASGCVTIVGASLPVSIFKPKQTPTGVTVKIKKEGGYKLIKGAFIATMKSGHTGVFWREWHGKSASKSGKRWAKGIPRRVNPKTIPKDWRLKMHEIFTSSLPDVIGDTMPMAAILADAETNLQKNIEHELDYELSKL